MGGQEVQRPGSEKELLKGFPREIALVGKLPLPTGTCSFTYSERVLAIHEMILNAARYASWKTLPSRLSWGPSFSPPSWLPSVASVFALVRPLLSRPRNAQLTIPHQT